jgi:hypothetical protein
LSCASRHLIEAPVADRSAQYGAALDIRKRVSYFVDVYQSPAGFHGGLKRAGPAPYVRVWREFIFGIVIKTTVKIQLLETITSTSFSIVDPRPQFQKILDEL